MLSKNLINVVFKGVGDECDPRDLLGPRVPGVQATHTTTAVPHETDANATVVLVAEKGKQLFTSILQEHSSKTHELNDI